MGELIRDWIAEKLGIIIDLYNVTFSSKAQDGILLSRLLKSCGIISKEQFEFIVKTKDPEKAFENYNRYIKIWLRDLNINISQAELREIANGEGIAALNLFYKVYLKVFHKNIIDFETVRKCKEVKQVGNSRFKISRSIETKVEQTQPINSIVAKNWDVLNWHRDKILALSKKIDKKKMEYLEYLNKKCLRGSSRCLLDLKSKEIDSTKSIIYNMKDYPEEPDLSYDELIKEQMMVRNMRKMDCKVDTETIQITQKTFTKKRSLFSLSYTQKEIDQKDALQYLRDILENNQNEEFWSYLKLKRLKCSLFEQECISLLCEIKHRKQNLLQSRRFMNREYEKDMENERANILLLESKQIEDAQNNYYFERDRLNELYKRVSQVKADYIKKENIEMCTNIVEDLIEYVESITILHENLSWSVMINYLQQIHKLLFLKCKTIRTIYLPFEDILFYDPKCNDELNVMYAKEMERQHALNEGEFENYLNFIGEYEVIKESVPNENEELIQCGSNILGFIVHKLLLYKYPIEKPYKNPNITKPLITACVNGIYDFTILPILKSLLKSKDIKIIQVQDVVNYCLKSYQTLMNNTDLEFAENNNNQMNFDVPNLAEETVSFLDNCLPVLNKTLESEDSIPKTYGSLKSSKYVQADNKIEYSPSEMLGKTAYETLITGKCLSNYQIASMVVEYLKSLQNIKGWVLINFPENYEQATLLESLLSGTCLPDIESYLNDPSCEIEYLEIKKEHSTTINMKALRTSKLVPNISPVEKLSPFETYFSSYINIFQAPVDNTIGQTDLPPVHREVDENCDILTKLYTKQDCYYILQYQILDITTIKYLAKMIIGDYSLPIKNSLELFGEVVLSFDTEHDLKQHSPRSAQVGEMKPEPTPMKVYVKLAKPKSDAAVNVSEGKLPKVETKPDKAKKGKKDKNKKTDKKAEQEKPITIPKIITEDKEQQFPEIDVTDVEIIYVNADEVEEEILPKPGEMNWIYVDLPINPMLGSKLATLWENIETSYIKNSKNYLFMTRCLKYELLNYIDDLRTTFVQLIKKPDDGSKLLKDFQEMYNSIDPAFRSDDEIKCELHYRIYEFKTKLLGIYTEKLKDVEQKRLQVIDQNYFSTAAANMYNMCSKCLQIELDRFQNVLQLMLEYYTVMMTSKPNNEPRPRRQIFEEVSTSEIELGISNQINTMLKNLDEDEETSPLKNTIFNALMQESERMINDMKTIHMRFVSKLEIQKLQKSKNKVEPKKLDNATANLSQNSISLDLAMKVLDEWKTAIEGEIAHIRHRVEVFYEYSKSMFSKYLYYNVLYHKEIKEQGLERLEREQQNINTIVELFSLAVESENPIEAELDLVDDKLIVRPNILIHETISNSMKPTYERDVITLEKINRLVTIFMATSPTGIMTEREFIFLLRDIILNNAEDGTSPIFPRYWRVLTPLTLNQLSSEIFYNNQLINWKDFILWLLNCFPTNIQLLDAKNEFNQKDTNCTEVVSKDAFYDMNLWFHNRYQHHEIDLLKKILFTMYCLDAENLMYMEMLLDFCKDVDSIVGFAKALELYLGTLVCIDTEIGQKLITKFLEEKSGYQETLKTIRTHEHATIINDNICDISEPIIDFRKKKSSIIPEIYHPITVNKYLLNAVSKDDLWPTNNLDSSEMDIHESLPVYIFVSLDVLVLVFTAALNGTKTFEIEKGYKLRTDISKIYQQYKCYNFGNKVACHQILNDQNFKNIIESMYRFTYFNLKKIVNRLVGKIEDSL